MFGDVRSLSCLFSRSENLFQVAVGLSIRNVPDSRSGEIVTLMVSSELMLGDVRKDLSKHT